MRQGHGYTKIEANLRVHAFRNSPPHFVAIDVGMRFAHDPRADDFAVFRVWYGDYGGFAYGRMLGQGVLDLDGEKVLWDITINAPVRSRSRVDDIPLPRE